MAEAVAHDELAKRLPIQLQRPLSSGQQYCMNVQRTAILHLPTLHILKRHRAPPTTNPR